ncbi:MAG TPA: LysR family transcriptional regulator [Amaricoccus sp.]|uniref:LysR family transcriptional regulator n=1 Tax=Amaricoccus sp. TaxID=1872485 RepID=UPI002CB27948|nr:LysR family transcriptional regulator [Amaricoccus sp.]HMQ94300.1 LysR family transcriptional regulator [Amaricoccus sp.]HMR54627.1 LysR family transcriptional regulator [Amaricoccus sp.]HMU01665.1 LysR family transcriptional regulator [Amaricoccus sp.]
MAQAPLGALRVFEAAARHGSFSRAADELCVTQSAVSHQIRGLEAWLGSPLFERQGNRATLLPHAETLAQALTRSLADIENACRQARRAGGPPTLTIAAIPSVAVCWLIPRLGEFRALAPATEVRLVYAFHGQPIEFRDVDVAIVFGADPPDPVGAVVERFLPGATAPVCAPHLGIGRSATCVEMVRAGLLHDSDATGWRAWLEAEGEPHALIPGPVFEDFNLLRVAALAGQGVALCPLAIVADDLREGRLVQLSERTIRSDSAYYVVIRDHGSLASSSVVRLFRDWLLSTEAGRRRHVNHAEPTI